MEKKMVELTVDSKDRFVIDEAMVSQFVLGNVKFFKPTESSKRSRNSECAGREFDLHFDMAGSGLWDLIYHASEEVRKNVLTLLRPKHNPVDALDRRNGLRLDEWHEAGEATLPFASMCRGNLAGGLGLGEVPLDPERLAQVAQRMAPDDIIALVAKLQAKLGQQA